MDRKSMSPFADKKLESLDIVFENCEVYTVPADGIHRLSLGNISYSLTVHVNGLSVYEDPGSLHDWVQTDYVGLVLNEKGMKAHSCWEEMFDDCPLLKDRLKGQDITHFDLNFTDNTNLYVGVPWKDGNSEFDNKYQHTDIKEKFTFVDIAEDINEDEFKEENDDLYKFETFEPKIDFSESIKNGNFDNIEILTIDDEDDESFGKEVPNYVQAAFRQIDEELARVMWNVNQEEFDSPFDNTGNSFKNDIFEVEAYDWDEENNQEYNFKWGDYKVRWYKHSRRDPEANRDISPEECAKMLDECLKSIIEMDVDEEDLFRDESPNDKECLKCGNLDDLYPLKSGYYVCKECLDNLGKEQRVIREEMIDSLFEFGFDNYEDVCNIIETFEDIIKFIDSHIEEELTIKSLINILGSTRKVTALEEGLLEKEEKEEILKEFDRFYNKKN